MCSNPCRLDCLGEGFSFGPSSFDDDDFFSYGECVEVEYNTKRRKFTIISSDAEAAISSVIFFYHRPKETKNVAVAADANEPAADNATSTSGKTIKSTVSRSKSITGISIGSMRSKSSKGTSTFRRLGLAPSFASRSVGASRMRSRVAIKNKNKNNKGSDKQEQRKESKEDTSSNNRGRTRGRSPEPRSRARTRTRERCNSRDTKHRPLPSHKQVQAANRKKRHRSRSSGSLASVRGRMKLKSRTRSWVG